MGVRQFGCLLPLSNGPWVRNAPGKLFCRCESNNPIHYKSVSTPLASYNAERLSAHVRPLRWAYQLQLVQFRPSITTQMSGSFPSWKFKPRTSWFWILVLVGGAVLCALLILERKNKNSPGAASAV